MELSTLFRKVFIIVSGVFLIINVFVGIVLFQSHEVGLDALAYSILTMIAMSIFAIFSACSLGAYFALRGSVKPVWLLVANILGFLTGCFASYSSIMSIIEITYRNTWSLSGEAVFYLTFAIAFLIPTLLFAAGCTYAVILLRKRN